MGKESESIIARAVTTMLLDEIIQLAADDGKSVTNLLRKCLILGHKLKNQRLITWSNEELKGYSRDQELPDYRIVPAGAKGYMSGPFGSSINNFPIPSALLEKEHREFATHARLAEAISAYEALLRSDSDSFRIEWPADLVLFYQRRIGTENGCHLAQAWQPFSKGQVAKVIDSVRNRTLNLALEMRGSISEESDLNDISPQQAATLDRTVTNNIYGGVNVLASSGSTINSTISNVQNSITEGSLAQLKTALQSAGIPESSQQQLSDAIGQDGDFKFGDHVMTWIKQNASRMLVGGIKIGAAAGQSVLTEYLKQYFGISR